MHVTFASVVESFRLELSDDVISLAPRWSRHRWNGFGQFIELQVPGGEHIPFIAVASNINAKTLWKPTSEDLLAGDWYVVEESA